MVAIQLPVARRATLTTRTARTYAPRIVTRPEPRPAALPVPRVQGMLGARHRSHPVASFFSSLGAHLMVISVILVATQASVGPPLMATPDTTMVFLQGLRPVPAERVPARPEPPPERAQGPGGGALLIANPPPKGFQTVIAPTSIPDGIPPVDPDEKPYDPRDFTGVGVEGGVSYGLVGGTGPVNQDLTAGLGEALFTATSREAEFAPAEVVFQPAPVYPPALLRAGLEGSLRVRFIIDTTGRVEAASFQVLEASLPGFEPAVRATILGSRFRPARLGAVAVRQLTEQRVSFVLEDRP